MCLFIISIIVWFVLREPTTDHKEMTDRVTKPSYYRILQIFVGLFSDQTHLPWNLLQYVIKKVSHFVHRNLFFKLSVQDLLPESRKKKVGFCNLYFIRTFELGLHLRHGHYRVHLHGFVKFLSTNA